MPTEPIQAEPAMVRKLEMLVAFTDRTWANEMYVEIPADTDESDLEECARKTLLAPWSEAAKSHVALTAIYADFGVQEKVHPSPAIQPDKPDKPAETGKCALCGDLVTFPGDRYCANCEEGMDREED